MDKDKTEMSKKINLFRRIQVLLFFLIIFSMESVFAQIHSIAYSKELQKLANGGDLDAKISLAMCYGYGLGIKSNEKKALKLFEEVKDRNSRAEYEYGVYKIKRNFGYANSEREVNRGITYILSAASGGFGDAQLLAARMHRGTAPNGFNIYSYYKQTYIDANYDRTGHGFGFYKDAISYYQKCAEHGGIDVQIEFADYLCDIGHVYADSDMAESSAYWYKIASEEGYAVAQLKYGICCQNGFGVTQNVSEALKWFVTAAELGNADAMNSAALILIDMGNVENINKGIDWLKKASEVHNVYAMYNLGIYYKEGRYVTQDENKAFELFSQCSESELLGAYYELAQCYETGYGCNKNLKKAAEFYEKAAHFGTGIEEAVKKIIYFYENGIGVYMDKEKAKKFCRYL